jgi:hypothetical protein
MSLKITSFLRTTFSRNISKTLQPRLIRVRQVSLTQSRKQIGRVLAKIQMSHKEIEIAKDAGQADSPMVSKMVLSRDKSLPSNRSFIKTNRVVILKSKLWQPKNS